MEVLFIGFFLQMLRADRIDLISLLNEKEAMQQEKYSMLDHLQLAVISRNKNGLKYFNNAGKRILYQCSDSLAQDIGILLKLSKMQQNGFFDKEITRKDIMTA